MKSRSVRQGCIDRLWHGSIFFWILNPGLLRVKVVRLTMISCVCGNMKDISAIKSIWFLFWDFVAYEELVLVYLLNLAVYTFCGLLELLLADVLLPWCEETRDVSLRSLCWYNVSSWPSYVHWNRKQRRVSFYCNCLTHFIWRSQRNIFERLSGTGIRTWKQDPLFILVFQLYNRGKKHSPRCIYISPFFSDCPFIICNGSQRNSELEDNLPYL